MRNALKYSKMLIESGVPQEQAEAHVEVMETIVGDNLATKKDLEYFKFEMHSKLEALENSLRSEFRSEINSLRGELGSEVGSLKNEFKNLELRMVIKLGTILSVIIPLSIGSVVAIVKLIS